jgi:hypothetical protein
MIRFILGLLTAVVMLIFLACIGGCATPEKELKIPAEQPKHWIEDPEGWEHFMRDLEREFEKRQTEEEIPQQWVIASTGQH